MTQVHNLVSWLCQENTNNQLLVLMITILLLILASLRYKSILSNSSNGVPSLPPGPHSFPIIGYLPFRSPDLHTQFTKMARTYGPIFKFKVGSKLHVVINTPELVKVVVRDQDEAFSDRDQSVAALLVSYGGQDIIFSKNNHNWRKLRKIFVHEIQSNINLKASASFRREEVRKTIKNLLGKVGTAVNIREMAFDTETNVILRMIWENPADNKAKSHNLGAEINMVATNIVKTFGWVNLSDFFPGLAGFDLQGVERDMKMQFKKLDAIFTSIIEDRIEFNFKMSQGEMGRGGKKDFVQILLDHKDENDGSVRSLNMTQMKALLLYYHFVLIAGTDTTETTVEWAMAIIMQNPNVMKRVQEELLEIVGLNNMVEESYLPNLHYLNATFKETLRLYPIVPFLVPRSTSKACTIGGYAIPKGCTIFINVWSIHRDPRYWDNPLEFNPDRFLTDKWDYKGNNLTFFLFGSGRRSCAGAPLAEKMIMLILASLLHSLDWSLPNGEEHDLTETFGIVLKKRRPLAAIPSKRLPDAGLYM
ncbi:flavonoid 3',5'-hydroxylase 1-like [Bidens hawaiensis]|uniref:flavonoid 3',5'-hydroxylase 1-like n=1 Tax=Bidens hawaiensis TaxID=980011 RepID=UPI00404AF0B4